MAPPNKDWWKLVAVAAVGIVLAGVGTLIASNLAPSSASADPVAAPTVSTTDTRVTITTVATPVVTSSGGTSSTTLTSEAPVLEVSDTTLDFGETDTDVSFQLSNAGGGTASWSIESPDASVTTDPEQGELGSGETQTVSVGLDRTTVSEGELGVTLTLSWNEEEIQVFVTGVHALNPVIVGPRATPSTVQVASGSLCTPTLATITVRVKDTSDLAEVIVRWSNGTSVEETPMSAVDVENYEAVIGPFTAVVSPNAKIVAKDVHDNAGGAPVALSVIACP